MSDTVQASFRGTAGTAGTVPAMLVLVAKYRDLDLESAAALHAAAAGLAQHLVAGSTPVAASVVLSTCNRFEIYCDITAGAVRAARADALGAVHRCSGLPMTRLSALFEELRGAAAAEHLFAVAAGLDSLVVGEREVAGQVRRALAAAQAAGTSSARLDRLFQAASRTAKDVGSQTALSSAGASIASVALDLAAGSRQAGIAGTSAVLVGTGSYAGRLAELLRNRKCAAVSVFSHSGRAEAFVAARGGSALSAGDLPAAVAGAGLLIGCSGAGARIDAAALGRWRADTVHPLTVIDLAPSHDFDPRMADLPGVDLITLDSVHRSAPPADAEALRSARALVRKAARRFEEQDAVRGADAAVVALRSHLEGLLRSEMDRVSTRHGGDVPADEVNRALRHLVRRLLHAPTLRARELAAAGRQDDYTAALDALFGLSVPAAGPKPAGCAGTARCPGTCSTLQLITRPQPGTPAATAAC